MKTKPVPPASTIVSFFSTKVTPNEYLIQDNLILIRNIADALDILAGNVKTETLIIKCFFSLLVFIYNSINDIKGIESL